MRSSSFFPPFSPLIPLDYRYVMHHLCYLQAVLTGHPQRHRVHICTRNHVRLRLLQHTRPGDGLGLLDMLRSLCMFGYIGAQSLFRGRSCDILLSNIAYCDISVFHISKNYHITFHYADYVQNGKTILHRGIRAAVLPWKSLAALPQAPPRPGDPMPGLWAGGQLRPAPGGPVLSGVEWRSVLYYGTLCGLTSAGGGLRA